MANGTAMAHLPLPRAPSTGAPAHPPKLSIERQIGIAAAAAARVIAVAMLDYQRTGALPRAIRDEGGSAIAEVVQLQLGYCGDGFSEVVRTRGKLALRKYFDESFYQQYSREQGDAVIDLLIDGLLEIVDRVIKFEKAWAN